MGNPLETSQFHKFLTERLAEISKERQQYHDLKDIVPIFYTVDTNSTRPFEEYATMSGVPTIPKFTGRLTSLSLYPGYSVKIEPGEYGAEIITQRKLMDDQQFGLMEEITAGLVDSANRLRQINAAKTFINATSIGFDFQFSEEGVALASSSHNTKVPGVSTATGFSNVGTSALTPTSLAAARLLMRRYKTSIGERYDSGDSFGIVHPDALSFKVEEIIGTDKGLYSAEGTINVHKGRYTSIPLMRWDDYSTTSWALVDMTTMKKNLMWIQRAKAEMNRTIDFNTLELKQSVYERHGYGWKGWRWIYFNNVG